MLIKKLKNLFIIIHIMKRVLLDEYEKIINNIRNKKVEKIKFEFYKNYYFINLQIESYKLCLVNSINEDNDSVYPFEYDSDEIYTLNDFTYTSINSIYII